MQLFNETGEELERRWRDAEYDERAFPELAATVLSESKIPEKVSIWEIVEWTLAQTNLPVQRDLFAKFGEPPITLFNASRFHIDVYFWLDGTTAIHQHSFCGAFQVLHGSSIHSQYSFETDKIINAFLKLGKLNLYKCELFEVGSVQQINPGDRYIHALFHLDEPSVTIVARTHLSPLEPPQFSYHKPGLAIDPFFEEPNTIKKIQTLTAAVRAKHKDADKYIEDLIRTSDFHTSFQILREMRRHLQKKGIAQIFELPDSSGRFEKLIRIAADAHPDFSDIFEPVFEEAARSEKVINLRSIISEKEHRFFLALLLNVDGLERILSLIKDRFPEEDPREKMLDWISELANTKVLDGSFPNGLGVEGFTDFDGVVLEEMLDGKTDEAVVQELLKMAGTDEGTIDKITESIAKIKGAAIFRPLLK